MLTNWLRDNRTLPKHVWGIMHVLPDQATPMEALRTVASTLSMFDKSCAHEETGGSSLCRAVSLTGKLPTIVASFDRLRKNKPPIEPRPDLGHGENFVYMLTGELPDEVKARAIEGIFNSSSRPRDECLNFFCPCNLQYPWGCLFVNRNRIRNPEGTFTWWCKRSSNEAIY